MKRFSLVVLILVTLAFESSSQAEVGVMHLRCEYLKNPIGIDIIQPRLSWRLDSDERGIKQRSYRVLVASSIDSLIQNRGDLWDSGEIATDNTLFIRYAGKPLASRQECYWKTIVTTTDGRSCESEPASWSMALLNDDDWISEYISYTDETPIHTDRSTLYLPPARQYRKDFRATKDVRRATLYATALGIYELHLNGKRVGESYFAPGWTDYRQRAYYNTYDVTDSVRSGDNAIGIWVADGWYSGYVGFGLLTGMGTERIGRYTYGKTPVVMVQLEIEYSDGSVETIGTDSSWKVTGKGPIQEADLLMGEAYDARKEMPGWSHPGFNDEDWDQAIAATDAESVSALFFEGRNPTEEGRGPKIEGRQRDLSFQRPKLEAFPGVSVRVTEEMPAKTVTRRGNGSFVFDLGQNFAGTIRLKVRGPAGHKVTIRYGEMLHPDGRLMTENLRKARATDFYTCKGGDGVEIYEPRFTFHGFQFVEVTNFPGEAKTDSVTGLVLHSDTPMTSEFACSDPMVNQLFSNVVWTQRANFLDLPTDCPQRDERMGWTGDAQAYVGTAAYNADIGAFYTKWLRELMESQRPSGAFPGYAPFPFQHGWDFGSAWADAGVICPWTIWQVYGDTQVIEDCWEPMVRFMEWRQQTSQNDLGVAHGNAWGDWLAQGASTPLEYVDTVYLAISAKMMSEMAAATGRDDASEVYSQQFERTKAAFAEQYLREDSSVKVNTQTAQALALFADLIPDKQREATARHLAKMIHENGNHMSTGFLGTRPLLPVLSHAGQHDLATFLLQSREFPSWGYEISNGATTIWERWDSYTKEDAFGRHNAAMNSFSHYAFGAVCEWMFHTLAGIQSDEPGYKSIVIRPHPPSPGSNAMHDPINWVRAEYESIRGTIKSQWKIDGDLFSLDVTIPANTTAMVYLPASSPKVVTEGGQSLAESSHVRLLGKEGGAVVLAVDSGDYSFRATGGIKPSDLALKTAKPQDNSINPENIDLTSATRVAHWDFKIESNRKAWKERNHCDLLEREGKVYVVATGDDPQLAVRLPDAVSGPLVVQVRLNPGKGVKSQFYWAAPQRGFNATNQSQRSLMASDQMNNYLFAIESKDPIKKLRFDPFQSYDKYAKENSIEIDSISIYRLSE